MSVEKQRNGRGWRMSASEPQSRPNWSKSANRLRNRRGCKRKAEERRNRQGERRSARPLKKEINRSSLNGRAPPLRNKNHWSSGTPKDLFPRAQVSFLSCLSGRKSLLRHVES